MTSLEIPALAHLLSYFHADWVDADWSDADANPGAVVDRFYRGEGPQRASQAMHEVDLLLGAVTNDAELGRRLFWDYSCFYDPTLDGLSNTDWLRSVQRQLRANLEADEPRTE